MNDNAAVPNNVSPGETPTPPSDPIRFTPSGVADKQRADISSAQGEELSLGRKGALPADIANQASAMESIDSGLGAIAIRKLSVEEGRRGSWINKALDDPTMHSSTEYLEAAVASPLNYDRGFANVMLEASKSAKALHSGPVATTDYWRTKAASLGIAPDQYVVDSTMTEKAVDQVFDNILARQRTGALVASGRLSAGDALVKGAQDIVMGAVADPEMLLVGGAPSKIPMRDALMSGKWGNALAKTAGEAAVKGAAINTGVAVATEPLKWYMSQGTGYDRSLEEMRQSLVSAPFSGALLGAGFGSLDFGLEYPFKKSAYEAALPKEQLAYVTNMKQRMDAADAAFKTNLDQARMMDAERRDGEASLLGLDKEELPPSVELDAARASYKQQRAAFKDSVEAFVNSDKFKERVANSLFDIKEILPPEQLRKQRDQYDTEMMSRIISRDPDAIDAMANMQKLNRAMFEKQASKVKPWEITEEQKGAADLISQVFNRRVRYFDPVEENVKNHQGAVFGSMPQVLYIAKDMTGANLFEVVHHEFFHSLGYADSATHGELTKHILDFLGPQGLLDAYNASGRGRSHMWSLLSEPRRMEELLADVFPKLANQKEFWDRLMEKNPGLYDKVMSYLDDAQNKIKAAGKASSSKYVKQAAGKAGDILGTARANRKFNKVVLSPAWMQPMDDKRTAGEWRDAVLHSRYKDALKSLDEASRSRHLEAMEDDTPNIAGSRYVGSSYEEYAYNYLSKKLQSEEGRAMLNGDPLYTPRTPQLVKTLIALNELRRGNSTIQDILNTYHELIGELRQSYDVAEGAHRIVAVRGPKGMVHFYEVRDNVAKVLDEWTPSHEELDNRVRYGKETLETSNLKRKNKEGKNKGKDSGFVAGEENLPEFMPELDFPYHKQYSEVELSKLYKEKLTAPEFEKYRNLNWAPVVREVPIPEWAEVVARQQAVISKTRELITDKVIEMQQAIEDLGGLAGENLTQRLGDLLSTKAEAADKAGKVEILTKAIDELSRLSDDKVLELGEAMKLLPNEAAKEPYKDALDRGLITDEGIYSDSSTEAVSGFDFDPDASTRTVEGAFPGFEANRPSDKTPAKSMAKDVSKLVDWTGSKLQGAFKGMGDLAEGAVFKKMSGSAEPMLQSRINRLKVETVKNKSAAEASLKQAQDWMKSSGVEAFLTGDNEEAVKVKITDPVASKLLPELKQRHSLMQFYQKQAKIASDSGAVFTNNADEAIRLMEKSSADFKAKGPEEKLQFLQDLRKARNLGVPYDNYFQAKFDKEAQRFYVTEQKAALNKERFNSPDRVEAALVGRQTEKTVKDPMVQAGNNLSNQVVSRMEEVSVPIGQFIIARDLANRLDNDTLNKAVYKEQHGLDSGNKDAKDFVSLMNTLAENHAAIGNSNGGDFWTSQNHSAFENLDETAARRAGFGPWYREWRKAVDVKETSDRLMLDGSEEKIKEIGFKVYSDLVNGTEREVDVLGRYLEGDSRLMDQSYSKRIVYDPDRGYEFFKKFGTSTSPIRSEISGISRKYESLPFLETFGNNAKARYETLVGSIDASQTKKAYLRSLYEMASGELDVPQNRAIAKYQAVTHQLSNMAALGLSMPTNLAADAASTKMVGDLLDFQRGAYQKFLHLVTKGADASDPVMQHIIDHGAGAQTLHLAYSTLLNPGEPMVNGIKKMHTEFMRANGMRVESVVMERAFTGALLQHMAGWVEGGKFSNESVLDLARFALTPKDFEGLPVKTYKSPVDGSSIKMLDINAIEDPVLRQKLGNFLIDSRDMAVFKPDNRAKLFARLGTKSGTIAGAAVRGLLQYMEYPISNVTKMYSFLNHAYGYTFLEAVRSGKMNGAIMNTVWQAGYSMALMLAALNVKELLSGREPVTFLTDEQRKHAGALTGRVAAATTFGIYNDALRVFSGEGMNPGSIAGPIGNIAYRAGSSALTLDPAKTLYQARNAVPFHQVALVNDMFALATFESIKGLEQNREQWYQKTYGQGTWDPLQ